MSPGAIKYHSLSLFPKIFPFPPKEGGRLVAFDELVGERHQRECALT